MSIRTKDELLAEMKERHACYAATDWVKAWPGGDARECWKACPQIDWMIWFGARRNPQEIRAFAKRCATRAGIEDSVEEFEDCDLSYEVENLADDALYSPLVYRSGELAAQLKDLHDNVDAYLGGK